MFLGPRIPATIYIHYTAPPYRLASAPFTSSRLAKFGWVSFAVCNPWQRSRTQNLRRVGEISDPILTRLWTKVHTILTRCRKPSYFPIPLPGCLCHVWFRRFSPLSLEVVEKPNKCKKFLALNFWEGRPRLFYGRLLARFTVHRLAKFGRVPSAKPCNELESRIYGGWAKMTVQF